MVQNARRQLFGFAPPTLVQAVAHARPGYQQTPVFELVVNGESEPLVQVALHVHKAVEENR